MIEQAALIFGFGFIAALLAWDARRTPSLSPAVWLAAIWMILLASRPVAQWFDPQVGAFGTDPADGSPLDRALLSVLIVATGIALLRRQLKWQLWFSENKWIFALVLFAGVSVVWSDFSEVAAKRWVRGLGSVFVVMLVLSERDPAAAIAAVVRRSSIVLVPMSIILIKYFRPWAVDYNYWTGEEYLAGATTDKNALGRYCMIVALFAFWNLRARSGLSDAPRSWLSSLFAAAILVATLWLLWASKSSTSLACLIFGGLLLAALGLPAVRSHPQRLVIGLIVSAAALVPLGLLLNLPEFFVTALGRDMTLTGRVFIWHDLLGFETNPVIGVGYDSFWLGERLEWFIRMHQVNSAHNGFLEVYLSLGAVGLFLLGGVVLSALKHAQRTFATDEAYGQLRLLMIFVFLAYNMTETATLLTSLMLFVFLLASMQPPQPTHEEELASGTPGITGDSAHGGAIPHGTHS